TTRSRSSRGSGSGCTARAATRSCTTRWTGASAAIATGSTTADRIPPASSCTSTAAGTSWRTTPSRTAATASLSGPASRRRPPVEHRQDTRITYSTFDRYHTAVHLWRSPIQDPGEEYPKRRDRRNRHYAVSANKFIRNKTTLRIHDTQNVRLVNNTYTGVETI